MGRPARTAAALDRDRFHDLKMGMRRPGIWVGLIALDALRVRRLFALVLRRWQDRVVIVLMASCAILAATAAFRSGPGSAIAPAWAALAALLLGGVAGAAHQRRLEGLARSSIAAPLALMPRARGAHLAAFSALLLLLALAGARAALTGLFTWPVIGLIVLAWAAGTPIGAAVAAFSPRLRFLPAVRIAPAAGSAPASGLLAITLRAQLPFRAPGTALLAAFAIGMAQAGAVGLWARSLNLFAGGAVAAAAGLIALLAVARVPAGPCRFGTFAGVPTADAVAAHLAVPLAATLGAMVGALVHRRAEPGLVWLELGCGLAAAFAVAFRVLHYRVHPKPRADRLMQVQLALLAMAAFGLPPLAPLLVAWRGVALYRASRRAMWMVA
jgi:hypothetical protein